MAEIKVCSFNLRVDVEKDGINRFTNRKGRILEVINNEKPDIIGFQEASDNMREWLRASLCDYLVIGCGREKNYRGESTVVAVRNAVFDLVSFETFWLSYAPDEAGSRFGGDQSGCPRVATGLLLKHRESEELFRFCNTHLDHKGETARLLGIIEVMQYLSKYEEKFVLTGDFNARPESPVIEAMRQYVHAGRAVTEPTEKLGGTFHDFGRKENPTKIDYIFTDAEADPEKAYAASYPPVDGVYVSDHDPIFAYVNI